MRPHLSPPMPDSPAEHVFSTIEKMTAKVPPLHMSGLNAGSRFDMRRFLGAPILGGAAASPTAPREFRCLVALVSFADKAFSAAQADYYHQIFNTLVQRYYLDQSGGKLKLTADVFEVVLDKPYEYYNPSNYGFGSFPRNAQGMALETFGALSFLGDFTPYDNNGDGYVDGFVVIHAGKEAAVTGDVNDIWAHQWGFNTQTAPDGTKCNLYLTIPELFDDTVLLQQGIVDHELGHLMLNLPDLYQQPYARDCLMANLSWRGFFGNDPGPLCAPMKMQAGFIEPRYIAGLPEVFDLSVGEAVAVRVTSGDPRKMIVLERKTIPRPGYYVWMVDNAIRGNGGSIPQVRLLQQSGALVLDGVVSDDFLVAGQSLGTDKTAWYDGTPTDVVASVGTDEVVTFGRSPKYDIDLDGDLDIDDIWTMVDAIFFGGKITSLMDLNYDGDISTLDLNVLIDAYKELQTP